MMIVRKEVNESKTLSLYELEGNLVVVRKYFDELVDQYGEEARLELDWDYEDCNLILRYQRLETEKEAEKRIVKAQKAKATRDAKRLKKEEIEEEADRKEWARLQEKYGEE